MTTPTKTEKEKEHTFQVRVSLVVEVDAPAWIDYHRVQIGLDQTLRQACVEDVVHFFDDAEHLNQQLGDNFTTIAKII